MWRADTILNALKKNVPAMQRTLNALPIDGVTICRTLQQEFAAIEGKSIDYAVMEKYPNVVVIEAPFPWDDVGSWLALERLHGADAKGNTVVGSHVGWTREDRSFTATGHTIVTIDMED